MTSGQERALHELKRLQAADPDGFELIYSTHLSNNNFVAYVSIRLGPINTKEGGLDLMEREEFIIVVPPDFPFDTPWIKVTHERFANFPHVVWKNQLCIYQSKEVEWNPSDGLYGLFDRLKIWLGRAAINDMDPAEGPLEPPHHVTAFSQLPFVIRENAPVEAGKSWFGVAELKKYDNRIELFGWNDLSGKWPTSERLALAIILEKPLPMEFPEKGEDFFKELLKQGMSQEQIIKNLAIASLFTPDEEPIYLILGLPMRRASDGTTKIHIAVWITSSDLSKYLRGILPKKDNTEKILNLRKDFSDKLYSFFKGTTITWCRVMEDRSEIIVRRDKDSPLTWFTNKKVLVLGCGALGSWVGEIIARAKPSLIHLVDKSKVSIGILSRQNYVLDDFCSNKSEALAKRLKNILEPGKAVVEHFPCEAHKFLTEDIARINSYDVIIDCTASEIFQMKLERDWSMFQRNTPNVISMVIDAKAERCLAVAINSRSSGGILDAYVQLRKKISIQGGRKDIISAFYSRQAVDGLFQPEPGCSDPTFSGSTADMFSLVSTALNFTVNKIVVAKTPSGIAFSMHTPNGSSGKMDSFDLLELKEVTVGKYRVRISANNIEREARAWVRQNKRIRSSEHETGGLLWGVWDDAVNIIWLFDLSGPPPDSDHGPGYFICGIQGTADDHERRLEQNMGMCGFIGLWHTHPDMSSRQSTIDMTNMVTLVSSLGHNQTRVLMLIFGRSRGQPTANIYIYESYSFDKKIDLVSVGEEQIELSKVVV
jgi:tRNA A37 threonylcarbamoyladenosine dehydratase/ubiquitin-protein ligase